MGEKNEYNKSYHSLKTMEKTKKYKEKQMMEYILQKCTKVINHRNIIFAKFIANGVEKFMVLFNAAWSEREVRVIFSTFKKQDTIECKKDIKERAGKKKNPSLNLMMFKMDLGEDTIDTQDYILILRKVMENIR